MHLALRIFEILLIIFREVSEPSTLFRASLVCTAWSTPALDVLYKERVVAFEGLFSIFSHPLLGSRGHINVSQNQFALIKNENYGNRQAWFQCPKIGRVLANA